MWIVEAETTAEENGDKAQDMASNKRGMLSGRFFVRWSDSAGGGEIAQSTLQRLMKLLIEFIVDALFLERLYVKDFVGTLAVMSCVKDSVASCPDSSDMFQSGRHPVDMISR
jgi:hypothetical protein